MSVKVFKRLVSRTFNSERKFQIFIQESAFDFIPRGIKKPIYKTYLKEELFQKHGDSAFIFPEERLFPVININTGDFDCRLIQYAVIRAYALKRIHSRFDIYLDRSLEFFNKYSCKESETITLVDEQRTISLISFLKYLDNHDGKMIFVNPEINLVTRNDLKNKIPNFKNHYTKYKRLRKSSTHKY